MKNKILENLKLGLAGLVFAGCLNSCTNPHLEVLKKYSPLTKEEKDSLFKDLNYGLKEFLSEVYLIEEKDLPKNHRGHTHEKSLCMCLIKQDLDFETKLHESTHVRHGALNKAGADFSEEWEQIANFEYGKKKINYNYLDNGSVWTIRWKEGSNNPKNGLLCPYGAEDMYEDVATFVESLSYVNEKEWVKEIGYQKLYPLFFADTTDHRYKQKLDLLKEYNFLTKEEHEKLSKNLGSLNYLLKEKKNKKCP